MSHGGEDTVHVVGHWLWRISARDAAHWLLRRRIRVCHMGTRIQYKLVHLVGH
jgi:hypothetical protein